MYAVAATFFTAAFLGTKLGGAFPPAVPELPAVARKYYQEPQY